MMIIKVAVYVAILVLSTSNLVMVNAFPASLKCANGETAWNAGSKAGYMGIPTYSDGSSGDCVITLASLNDNSKSLRESEEDIELEEAGTLKPCATYAIKVTSKLSLGHKIKTSAGAIQASKDFKSAAQKNEEAICRNAYSQKESRFVFQAPEYSSDASKNTITLSALCGSSSSGKVFVAPKLTFQLSKSEESSTLGCAPVVAQDA